MKNSIISYDSRELKDFDDIFSGFGEEFDGVFDYFTHNTKVYEIIINYKDRLSKYRVDPYDTLEKISYKLYGTTNYWDILLLINKLDPLFCTPVSDDYIETRTTQMSSKYKEEVYFQYMEDIPAYEILNDDISAYFHKLNEDRRVILIVNPNSIESMITTLRQTGFIK